MFFPERIKDIKSTDRVLEIGPGGTPHPRSDQFLEKVFVDLVEAKVQRGNAPELKIDKKVVFFDGGRFPFKDKEFDYVICSHVLEHVEDVDFFTAELFRIAPKGYIEYPSIYYEYVYNIPVHTNFLKMKDNTLLYMKKNVTHLSDFNPVQALLLDALSKGYTSLVDDLKNVMFEGFEWNRPFKVTQTASIRELILEDISLPPHSLKTTPRIAGHITGLLKKILNFISLRVDTTMLRKIPKNLNIFNRPRTIAVEDSALIHGLKKKYTHSVREFYHGNNTYSADCIYCHAVPGTIETSLILLGDRLKTSNGNNRLLNLGGGTGQISKILTEIGFDVVNVDIEVKDEDPQNIKFDLNSEHEFPFEPEYFDFILCQEVIEHVENPWKLFRNIRRVLKKNGSLLLTTPNIQSNHSKKIFDKDGYFHWFTPDSFGYHVNPLPIWEIELIAERSGFIVKDIQGNGEYYFKTANQHNKQELIHNNECLIFIMEKKH